MEKIMGSETLQHVPVNMCLNSNSQNLTLTIIFHPDIERIGEQSRHENKTFSISRNFPLFGRGLNKDKGQQRPLNDQFISRTPLTMSKEGEFWRLEKYGCSTSVSICEQDDISSLELSPSMLERGCLITLAGRIVLLLHYTLKLSRHHQDFGLVGVSNNLTRVRTLIDKVAHLKTPVMVRGESGTGKELVAQALHNVSQRKTKKLINVNVAAIPKDLIVTELFGSTKGAFTGAVNRAGCFLQADNSSLFLDEIGEASPQVQVALLRVLETGVVQAVGSEKEQKVDVRIIAATDANLEQLIGKESFRMPLLQRLSGLVIEISPLRKRPEDIGVVLSKFLREALEQSNQLDKLVNTNNSHYCYWAWFYAQCCALQWPGNVRQIKNVAMQLSISLMEHKDVSTFDWLAFVNHISSQVVPSTTKDSAGNLTNNDSEQASGSHKRKPREIEDQEIIEALKKNNWQIKQSAEQLNISRAALYIRMDANPQIKRAGNLSATQLNKSFCASSGNLDEMVSELKVSKSALKRRLHEIGLSY